MSDAATTIRKLSEEFPKHVIRMKPGSAKRPAMPYVSHGSVTKRLNEVCPGWSSRVVETHTYINGNGVLVCAAVLLELTAPGVGSRQEFGTANQPRNFGDDAKNAASDALKRCAMRFGVAIDLWESEDEDYEDTPDPAKPAPARPQQNQVSGGMMRITDTPVDLAAKPAPARPQQPPARQNETPVAYDAAPKAPPPPGPGVPPDELGRAVRDAWLLFNDGTSADTAKGPLRAIWLRGTQRDRDFIEAENRKLDTEERERADALAERVGAATPARPFAGVAG